jgi:hypothetical protein
VTSVSGVPYEFYAKLNAIQIAHWAAEATERRDCSPERRERRLAGAAA